MTTFARLDGSKLIVGMLADRDIAVGALGNATFDLYAAADRPLNYYTWGGMGLAAGIGLGLALQCPDRRVVVLDGDGSVFMNPNALVAIGSHRPPNLLHLTWDNGIYQTTGGQATASATADLEALAKASGIERTATVRTLDALRTAIAPFFAASGGGPIFVRAVVSSEGPVRKPTPDPLLYRYRFLEAIQQRET
jgi:thiamine pyrophosphate-dependent acetolactate synthase large subunit-like protein